MIYLTYLLGCLFLASLVLNFILFKKKQPQPESDETGREILRRIMSDSSVIVRIAVINPDNFFLRSPNK